jgi:hypothetical protein
VSSDKKARGVIAHEEDSTNFLTACSFGWWLVLVCSERKVLLSGWWWLVCSEIKVLLAGG